MDEHELVRADVNPFAGAVASWGRAVGHLSNSVLEANRAAVAAFGGSTDDGEDVEAPPLASVDEAMAYREADWEFERSVEDREDVSVGDTVRFHKQLTDEEVLAFANITGDTNRLHLDDDFAAKTRFGRRIVHGTLVSGLISAALARIPGLTIYLSQDLRFLNPVDVGDHLTAVCEVVEDLGDRKYRLTTRVEDDDSGETVIDGEAVVLVDVPPADVDDFAVEDA